MEFRFRNVGCLWFLNKNRWQGQNEIRADEAKTFLCGFSLACSLYWAHLPTSNAHQNHTHQNPTSKTLPKHSNKTAIAVNSHLVPLDDLPPSAWGWVTLSRRQPEWHRSVEGNNISSNCHNHCMLQTSNILLVSGHVQTWTTQTLDIISRNPIVH
jgi:hypothetical protein